MGSSICHMLFRGSQIDGHFQIDGGDTQDTENFIREAVVCKLKTGFLIIVGAG